jgi:hypothetical protein
MRASDYDSRLTFPDPIDPVSATRMVATETIDVTDREHLAA